MQNVRERAGRVKPTLMVRAAFHALGALKRAF
jgi:hypothetical protein